ncbi:unnamed protein product [Rotaria sp. Silwood1]|nr:unnamed protein product [Rotaria sp. Silwood1]
MQRYVLIFAAIIVVMYFGLHTTNQMLIKKINKEATEKEEIKKGTIEKEEIKKGTIDKEEIKKGTTEKEEIKKGTTDKEEIKKGTIDKVEIKKGTIDKEEIKKGAIDQEEIKNGAIDKQKIKKEKVLLVTAIPPAPCKSTFGDFVNIQSIKNKLTYCQIKNFSFHFTTVKVDPLLAGSWNKLALVHYILENNLDYDWIFWFDVDTLILDMEFDIPFQDYSEYNFVLYGDKNLLYNERNVLEGLNTGIFLIRNNEWGRKFMKKACDLGKSKTVKMELALKNYDASLRDQNAVAYLLCQEVELRKKVFLEQRYQISGYWEEAKKNKKWNPFIMHFAGCEFCDGIYESKKQECLPYWKEFVKKPSRYFSKGLI